MRSIEKTRSRDLDMVDPEHLNKVGRESSWDDLKNVPFAGNQSQSLNSDIEKIKDLINSLPTDNEQLESPEKRAEIFSKMEEVGSFGKAARERGLSPRERSEDMDDTNSMSLSDISKTF